MTTPQSIGKDAHVIIAFEGMDGTGKTTQAVRLHERLVAAGVESVVLPLFRKDRVEFMLDALDDSGGVDNDQARMAVLAKVVARDEYLVRPLVARGGVVVYDKFLHTHLAAELVRGCDERAFVAAAGQVLAPDLSLLLTIDPRLSLARKDRVGFRESGLDLEEEAGRASYAAYRAGEYSAEWMGERFVAFQDRVRAQLESDELALTLPYASSTVRLDAMAEPDEVTRLVEDAVRSRRPDLLPD